MTLPDADPSRKPRKRRWLFAPYILALVLAIAWSGYWFYIKVAATRQLDQTAASLKAAGYELSWASRDFRGYPFRLEAILTDVRLAEPSGWAVSAPAFKAEAAAYQLGRWTAAAPEGAVLARPQGGAVVVRGDVLRASLSGIGRRPPNLSIEGVNLTFAQQGGTAPYPLSSAERLELHLRPGPNDQGAVLFKVDNATARFTGLLARIAQDRPVSLIWDSTLSKMSAFHGEGWREAVEAWTAAGGVATVRNAGMTAGDALISTHAGALTVGPDGRIRGALDVDLREAPRTDQGIPRTTEALIAAALAAGGATAQATLTFVDGQTTLGPVAVGPAPRVY